MHRAIELYYERGPGAKLLAKAVEDFLLDRRHPNAQRYLQRAGFPMKYEEFEGKASYGEWRLMYVPATPANQVGPQSAAAPGKA